MKCYFSFDFFQLLKKKKGHKKMLCGFWSTGYTLSILALEESAF